MTEDSASQSFFDLTAAYDRTVDRWLPVAASAISPDGPRFAYADYDLAGAAGSGATASTGRVHIVDARTGADQVVFSGSPTFSVIAFTSRGLYLSQVDLSQDALKGGPSPSGLFLLDPGGGTPQPVAGSGRTLDQHGWQIYGPNAWAVDFASGGGLISGNRVLSLDLESGEVRVWKTWDEGVLAHVLGLDSQHDPIVGAFASASAGAGTSLGPNGLQVWTFTSPDTGTLVYQTHDPIATLPGRPASSDAHAAWLGGNSPPSSVWRLAPGSGMVRVPVAVADSGWVGVAGACV